MEVNKIDHVVLTVQDIDETLAFYQKVLGMERVVFGEGRVALKFGNHKLNLHESGNEYEPKAMQPVPGSVDLCLITPTPLDEAIQHIESCGVVIIQGPVNRTGACGSLVSIYFRDPSGNLIEVANEA